MKRTVKKVEWILDVLMAEKQVRTSTQLARLMKDRTGFKRTPTHLTRYVKTRENPPALSLDFISAILTTLDADISDLFRVTEVEEDIPGDAEKDDQAEAGTGKEGLGEPRNSKPKKKAKTPKATEQMDEELGPKVTPFPTVRRKDK